jgi:hypothetical protein
MSSVRTAAEDYLATRRALGFKLGLQGRLLLQFVGYLEDCGLETVTAEAAMAWATAAGGRRDAARCGFPACPHPAPPSR